MKLENICHSYGNSTILTDIHLSLQPQKLTAFIGPNGAGKSTLLSLASRLIPKESGDIWIHNKKIESWNSIELAKELALLKQRQDIQAHFTVEELVSFGRYPYCRGKLREEDWLAVNRSLAYLDLEHFRKRPIQALSGGQLQRVFIAMVLAQDTHFIFLDEPLNNLDMKQGSLMMKTLRALVDDFQKTIVMVMHDINIASQYADEIVAFKDGEIFAQGDVTSIMQKPILDRLFEVDVTIREIDGKPFCIYR